MLALISEQFISLILKFLLIIHNSRPNPAFWLNLFGNGTKKCIKGYHYTFFYQQPPFLSSALACLAGTWFSASSVLSILLKEIYCIIYVYMLYYMYCSIYILLYHIYCTIYRIIFVYLLYYSEG